MRVRPRRFLCLWFPGEENVCPHVGFCVFVLILGVLLAGIARPAYALNHVAALRSGKIVVAVPSPAVFAVPPHLRMAILPVLLGSPDSPGEAGTYMVAKSRLQSAADDDLLATRVWQISTLPLGRDALSAAQDAAPLVKWIGQTSLASVYHDGGSLNPEKMRTIAFGSGTDATVFVQPVAVFASNFKRVYVIATVTVYAWGPMHAFYMGSKNLHAGISLNDTRPMLKTYGVESLAASNAVGRNASRGRVTVWFADDSARLKQALAADMQKIGKQVVAYLNGD